jgi:hypothetical protein
MHVSFTLRLVRTISSGRPTIAGIALPGLPEGSPGMGDDPTKTFTVYAVAKDGAKPMVSTFTDDQFVPHTSPNNSAAAR